MLGDDETYRVMRALGGFSDQRWSLVVQIAGLAVSFLFGIALHRRRSLILAVIAGTLANFVGQFLISGGGGEACVGVVTLPLFCVLCAFGGGAARWALGFGKKNFEDRIPQVGQPISPSIERVETPPSHNSIFIRQIAFATLLLLAFESVFFMQFLDDGVRGVFPLAGPLFSGLLAGRQGRRPILQAIASTVWALAIANTVDVILRGEQDDDSEGGYVGIIVVTAYSIVVSAITASVAGRGRFETPSDPQ